MKTNPRDEKNRRVEMIRLSNQLHNMERKDVKKIRFVKDPPPPKYRGIDREVRAVYN